MRMPVIKKVDENQAGIVAALRQAGVSVCDLHETGRGVPDLLCGIGNKNYLLEVKSGRGRLTPRESNWLSTWKGQAAIVHNISEALAALGIVESGEES